MLLTLLAFLIGAFAAPILARKGRYTFTILAIIPAAAFVLIASQAPRLFAGQAIEENWAWVPQLNLELTFRLDYLAWLMALIVTGVGALVLVYSSRYFSQTAQGLGRFGGSFVAFAGAMLGLVTTDNTLALYMFWELTTVFSFMLIGHNHDRAASRRAAMKAIIVTTAGGVAMLIGIIILGQIPGGSYRLSELIVASRQGTLGVAPIVAESVSSTLITTAIVLILVGALSKSALIPFHFWLPAAMAAPTPVSAYLHAAAMVKAGVYLVARLAPGFAQLTAWRWLIFAAGVGTLLIGGYRALKQTDLKLVLAFGTVSQLGLIMLMVGYGTASMLLAGLAMLVAHALFKSTLFLAIGQVDWATGTRDLRKLSGLWKAMPLTAIAAALAGASMMGLPGLLGFVAKESAFHTLMGQSAFSGGRATWTWLAIAAGSVLTVGYTLRFWWGAFATKNDVEPLNVGGRSWMMTIPVLTLATLGLVFGLRADLLDAVLSRHASRFGEAAGHLASWPGFGLPLYVTGAVLFAGAGAFFLRKSWVRTPASIDFPISAEGTYRNIIRGLEKLSGHATAFTQRGSLPAYLSTIFGFLLAALAGAIAFGGLHTTPGLRSGDSLGQILVVIVAIGGAVLGAASRHRMRAVLLMGISGYGVAFVYELYGAPDLALTQVVAETMTLVVFILVLRRLPAYFSNRPLKLSRWWRAGLATIVGVVVSLLAWLSAGARTAEPISTIFHDEAYSYGYGKNIVNVTLVDIRAWDTFGEISVVVAAAIGISSLLFIRDRGGRMDRFRNLPQLRRSLTGELWTRQTIPADAPAWRQRDARRIESTVRSPGRNRVWLAGSHTVSLGKRSVLLEVGVRLVFHTLVIVSLFFLFSGHNQPGGGFAGGLLAGIALVIRYLAGGRYELGAAIPLHPGHLLGSGLALAGTMALIPVVFGGTIFQSALFNFTLPAFGDVHLTTALFFDIGVYLVVVGLALDVVRSLGAEIDRHGELEGLIAEEPELFPREDARRNRHDAVVAHTQHATDGKPNAAPQPAAERAAEPAAKPAAESPAQSAGAESESTTEHTDPTTGITHVASDPATTSEMPRIQSGKSRKGGK